MHKSSLGKEKSNLQTVHCNEVLLVSAVQQIVLQRALSSSKAVLTQKDILAFGKQYNLVGELNLRKSESGPFL